MTCSILLQSAFFYSPVLLTLLAVQSLKYRAGQTPGQQGVTATLTCPTHDGDRLFCSHLLWPVPLATPQGMMTHVSSSSKP